MVSQLESQEQTQKRRRETRFIITHRCEVDGHCRLKGATWWRALMEGAQPSRWGAEKAESCGPVRLLWAEVEYTSKRCERILWVCLTATKSQSGEDKKGLLVGVSLLTLAHSVAWARHSQPFGGDVEAAGKVCFKVYNT